MMTLTKELLYQIAINDDDRFDLYVDGSYYSCANWVGDHFEMLGDVLGVDLTGCMSESLQQDRLIENNVRVQVKL
jgi:hypothetical protein